MPLERSCAAYAAGAPTQFPVKDLGSLRSIEMSVFSVLRKGFVDILYCVNSWVILLSKFVLTKPPEQITIHGQPVLNR